jgi:hypothetical protein
MRYILTLITLFACNYSYAENIALQCKRSDVSSWSIPIVINTDTMTLKYQRYFNYTLNHVSDDYYHANSIGTHGGDILVISRLNGKYWMGGVSTFCTDKTCSDDYKAVESSTGDCRLAF